MCHFQNSYVFSHLFEHNLVDLINKGVTCTELFNSDIFTYNYDYDEWPATSANTQKMSMPYNKSIFKMRYEYPNVFKNLHKEERKKKLSKVGNKMEEKVYKICYHANLITSMAEDEGTIMEAIAGSEELDIYKTRLVMDIIDYKWDTFGFATHRIGALMHFTYIIVLQTYISKIFLIEPTYDSNNVRINPEPDTALLTVLIVCLFYPV